MAHQNQKKVAWIVTLAGLASIQDAVSNSLLGGSPGGLAWFNLVLSLCLLLWIVIAVANGTGAIWNRSVSPFLAFCTFQIFVLML